MDDWTYFGLGMAIFFGAHLFAAFRPRGAGDLRVRMGESVYRAAFSVVSIAGLALLIVGYGDVRGAPSLWFPPEWARHIPMALMLPAMIFFVAAEAPMGRIKRAAKHPMLAGVKLWAFGHLAANGDLPSVILFGAFLAYAVLDRIVVKRRAAPSQPTPVTAKGDVIAVVGGIGLYLVIVLWAHTALIGVPVIY